MSLMATFSDPSTIDTLTFGQKMSASFITMIMGLGITFLVLILIWVFIVLMGKALNAADSRKSEPQATAKAEAKATPAAPATSAEAEVAAMVGAAMAAGEEVAAVIAAAIAAHESTGGKLLIKRMARTANREVPWTYSIQTEPWIERKASRPILDKSRKEF